MSVIYYDTERSTEEIVGAIVAIDDVIAPSNNGKVLCVENGKIKAKSVSSFAGEVVLETLNVAENGDFYPESGVDGFDEVHVAVPNTYVAGDEGKVVSNGALVAQTARATEITQNGTVDTTLNNSVTVNVSGGGSPTLQSKTVTPSAAQQTIQPDSGYDGLSSVVVNGDADLVAGNIKKDVEIFGVTGSYEGSGGGSSGVNPDYQGLSWAYIANNGNYYAENVAKQYYTNFFHVKADQRYALFIGSITSDRMRCHFYAGKSISDFEQYINNPMPIELIYTCTDNISGTQDSNTYNTRMLYTPASDGEIVFVTSRTSVSAKAYCVEVN